MMDQPASLGKDAAQEPKLYYVAHVTYYFETEEAVDAYAKAFSSLPVPAGAVSTASFIGGTTTVPGGLAPI